jgi:hypothetical protein
LARFRARRPVAHADIGDRWGDIDPRRPCHPGWAESGTDGTAAWAHA